MMGDRGRRTNWDKWYGTARWARIRRHPVTLQGVPRLDEAERFIEQRGYRPDIGLHGWPLDPAHPVYARRR
jgi:hypothetical protein